MPAKPPIVASRPNRSPASSASSVSSAKRPASPKRPATTPVKRIVLRARALMGDRGVRSVSALQRHLTAIGVAISVPQLIRVIDGEARHINKDVVEGMLTVLDCSVAELFAVV